MKRNDRAANNGWEWSMCFYVWCAGLCEGHKSHANMCVGCEQTHAAEDGGTIEVMVQDMGAVRTKKAKLQGGMTNCDSTRRALQV